LQHLPKPSFLAAAQNLCLPNTSHVNVARG
jgi:hypothetical protein